MDNKIICILAAAMAGTPGCADAQYNETRTDNIRSLQVMAGNDWLTMPVIRLGGEVPINISFDDLTHERHRYAYKVEHCEHDWSVSESIFESDYCDGFADGNTIDAAEESINTNTIYTHYTLTIPNDRVRLKKSGNYRVAIYDEDSHDTVAVAKFMVVEPLVNIEARVTSNTDIDTNKSHQQLAMKVCMNGLNVADLRKEIKTTVLQNGCWNNARPNAAPQPASTTCLFWDHCPELVFNGGNEYRKFEILDVDHPTLGIENIVWDGSKYTAELWPDYPRPSYVYDQDANGAFYIRNSDNVENDITTEYIHVRFRLKAAQISTPIYIDGNWTNGVLDERYKMVYNNKSGMYENETMLKQGYYSYRYITTDKTGGSIIPLAADGNFHQTENEYQILVYYRKNGGRTDRLVGYCRLTTK